MTKVLTNIYLMLEVTEDNVEIGAINTVVSGTIHPTVVEKYVKTDDHVHIAIMTIFHLVFKLQLMHSWVW